MNIKIITLTEEAVEKRDYRDAYAIEVNGERVFQVFDGEPEDANLSRDFNDVKSIPRLMKAAFEAGQNGEEIEVEYEEVEEI